MLEELEQSVLAAERAGIDRDQIVVDPGIGFAKNTDQNLDVLARLGLMHGLAAPFFWARRVKG